MDQMSDDERNSEHSDEDDEVRMNNDDGAMDEGAMGIKRDEGEDEGELESEEVARWGVVMVSEEGLEGKFKCPRGDPQTGGRTLTLCLEKKELFEQDKLSIHIYALSPAPVKVGFTSIWLSHESVLIIQDPGQYLVSNLALRSNKHYHNPAVYGTITGDALKNVPEVMRDGGIDFGTVPAKKKEDAPVKKKEVPKKEVAKRNAEKAVKTEPIDASVS